MSLDILAPTGLRDGTFRRALNADDAIGPDATLRAWCMADGVILYGTDTPSGAIELVRGEESLVRRLVDVSARHGYDGALLVPGVPEAKDEISARLALQEWINFFGRQDELGAVWNLKLKVTL